MVDRRRAIRYSIKSSPSAELTILDDAWLEWFDGERASVVTAQPAAPGDEFFLIFRTDGTAPFECAMRVCSSTPVFPEDERAFRLELLLADAAVAPAIPLTRRP